MRTPTVYSERSGKKLNRSKMKTRAACAHDTMIKRFAQFAENNPDHAERAFITLQWNGYYYVAKLKYSTTQGTVTSHTEFL